VNCRRDCEWDTVWGYESTCELTREDATLLILELGSGWRGLVGK
jgi:hypothetical protein